MKRDSRDGVTESPCTNCGKVNDAASELMDRDINPSPGDFAICFSCHHLMAYGDDMKLRELTDEEIKHYAGHPEILLGMKVLGRIKKSRRAKNESLSRPTRQR